ncbi:MAG TPA: NAD(P)-dependent oxidoreductase [Candidatus Paceibacterota bacterium]
MRRNSVLGKKVLILGGSGFIGSRTSMAFSDAGAIVKINTREDLNNMDRLVSEHNIIINLIAKINAHDLEYSRESQEINIELSKNLLKSVVKNNPECKIIFASSQTVYGIANPLLIDESFQTNPETIYARQKKQAESIYEEYAHKYNISVAILRLTNVYGYESKNSRSVISLFMKNALNDKNIEIFGDGLELRDYIYVDDVANAFVTTADMSLKNLIYNCGSGYAYSVKDIAEKIIKCVGKGNIVHVPFPNNYARYPGDIIIDSGRFNSETGWEARVNLEEGIKRIYNHYTIY